MLNAKNYKFCIDCEEEQRDLIVSLVKSLNLNSRLTKTLTGYTSNCMYKDMAFTKYDIIKDKLHETGIKKVEVYVKGRE